MNKLDPIAGKPLRCYLHIFENECRCITRKEDHLKGRCFKGLK